MPANAADYLRHHHRTLQDMFRAFEESEGYGEQKELLDTAFQELTIHARLESEAFYPALREATQGNPAIEQAEEEYLDVTTVLEDLRELDPSDPQFADKFGELEDLFDRHVLHVESDVIPLAEESGLDLEELETGLKELRHRLAAELAAGPRPPKTKHPTRRR